VYLYIGVNSVYYVFGQLLLFVYLLR